VLVAEARRACRLWATMGLDPGRAAACHDDVQERKDRAAGMLLEGVVTHVTNLGAFVDIGVPQDGLVYISMILHRFVTDPRERVEAGDVVNVKVLDVELQHPGRVRTMRLDQAAPCAESIAATRLDPDPRRPNPRPAQRVPGARAAEPAGNGVRADALARALQH
jgi:uncharacterized protein